MKFEFSQEQFARLGQRQTFVFGICGLLAASNVILALFAFGKEERWVLVPQFDIEHKVVLEGNHLPEQYLIDWADSVTRSILTANPSNIDLKVRDLLKISSTSYGAIKEDLALESKKIKENNMSTVFYPKSFTVLENKKKVMVKGQFLAYFGKDKNPVINDRTYEISWALGVHGVLLVQSFKDITTQKGDKDAKND